MSKPCPNKTFPDQQDFFPIKSVEVLKIFVQNFVPSLSLFELTGFDAVRQFRDRISTYIANGHPIDKIEILVLGGTWSEYPEGYQVRARCPQVVSWGGGGLSEGGSSPSIGYGLRHRVQVV